jgi:hypothetical protein
MPETAITMDRVITNGSTIQGMAAAKERAAYAAKYGLAHYRETLVDRLGANAVRQVDQLVPSVAASINKVLSQATGDETPLSIIADTLVRMEPEVWGTGHLDMIHKAAFFTAMLGGQFDGHFMMGAGNEPVYSATKLELSPAEKKAINAEMANLGWDLLFGEEK